MAGIGRPAEICSHRGVSRTRQRAGDRDRDGASAAAPDTAILKEPGVHMTSILAAGAGTIGVLLSSGLALAQPASTGEATLDPADTRADTGINVTLGAGAG